MSPSHAALCSLFLSRSFLSIWNDERFSSDEAARMFSFDDPLCRVCPSLTDNCEPRLDERLGEEDDRLRLKSWEKNFDIMLVA